MHQFDKLTIYIILIKMRYDKARGIYADLKNLNVTLVLLKCLLIKTKLKRIKMKLLFMGSNCI